MIDLLQFQLNDVGYLADRRPQIFVLDVPDPSSEPPITPVGRAAGCEPVSLVPAATQLTSAISSTTACLGRRRRAGDLGAA